MWLFFFKCDSLRSDSLACPAKHARQRMDAENTYNARFGVVLLQECAVRSIFTGVSEHMIVIQPSAGADTLKHAPWKVNPFSACSPNCLASLSACPSSFLVHLSALLFLTIQESLLSSWPEGATGCLCQLQGHQMGAVIIIASPLSCQCARQRKQRQILWKSRSKALAFDHGAKGKEPKQCAKSTRNVPDGRRREWKWQPSSRHPPLPWRVDVRSTGVWGPVWSGRYEEKGLCDAKHGHEDTVKCCAAGLFTIRNWRKCLPA